MITINLMVSSIRMVLGTPLIIRLIILWSVVAILVFFQTPDPQIIRSIILRVCMGYGIWDMSHIPRVYHPVGYSDVFLATRLRRNNPALTTITRTDEVRSVDRYVGTPVAKALEHGRKCRWFGNQHRP